MDISFVIVVIVLLSISVISLYSLYLERKKRITESENPNEHLQKILSSLEGFNIYMINRKFEYIYLNDRHREDMENVFGADIKIGTNKLAYLPELLSIEYERLYTKALEGHQFKHTQKFGDIYIKFDFYPNKSEKGEVESITVLAKDITENIRHEQELEKYRSELEKMVEERSIDVLNQRDFFQEVIDQVPNSIFVRNALGEYTLANKAFAETLGFNNRQEVIGKTIFATHSNSAEAELYFKEDQEILRDNIVVSGESQYVNFSGEARWLYLTKQRVEVGGQYHILGVHTDVTHLKNTQSKLENTNRELIRALEDVKSFQLKLIESEKMATVGQLTAGLIHEINNPINYVSGNVSPLKLDLDDIKEWLTASPRYLEKKEEIDETLAEMTDLVRGIEEGAARVKKIMVNLKRFSRPDKSETVYFDVNEGLDATISLIKPTVKDRIQFEKDFGDINKIQCSPGQMQQVFLNIIDNAKDAIKEKGVIHVSTREENGVLIIVTEDNGIGISEEDQQNIFEPFFTTKEKGHGTGLGLAISKRILSEHNGTLSVKSEPGKGSTFTIRLPLQKKE